MIEDPITRMVSRNLCTGCGACAGLFPEAIKMMEDPLHGRRPVVNPDPASREVAEIASTFCAGAGSDWGALPRKDILDANWGPILAAWEGWSADPEIRHRGSSGGAVTALSLHALSAGLASGVAHIAARQDDPRRNATVISRGRTELLRGAGSRYAQASPADALGRIASGAEPVVFVGKPCDIATVKKAAAADPILNNKLPLTIAIFCAGAPNLVATDKLLSRLGVPEDTAISELRYRGNGWPGTMQARWRDAQGEEHQSDELSYAKGWGGILQSERRWRCRICSDHTGAFADISVGDPWHTPPSGDADAGRSLIVARTERGRAFVEAAIRDGALIAHRRSRDVIARAQPNLAATHGAVWGRRLAMRFSGLPVPHDVGQSLFWLWWRLPIRQKLSSFLGTWRRIARERLWRPVRIAREG